MDVMAMPVDDTTWNLVDLLGRAIGVVRQSSSGFTIEPQGDAMASIEKGPHPTIDIALSKVETQVRGTCRLGPAKA